MIGIGISRIDVRLLPPGVVNGVVPATLVDVGVLAELHGCVAGGLAERTGVLPDVDGLRAECDPVEGGLVAVLTGHRHLAGEALRCEGATTPPAMPSFSDEHGVDLLFSAVRNCSISVWAFAGSQLSV